MWKIRKLVPSSRNDVTIQGTTYNGLGNADENNHSCVQPGSILIKCTYILWPSHSTSVLMSHKKKKRLIRDHIQGDFIELFIKMVSWRQSSCPSPQKKRWIKCTGCILWSTKHYLEATNYIYTKQHESIWKTPYWVKRNRNPVRIIVDDVDVPWIEEHN